MRPHFRGGIFTWYGSGICSTPRLRPYLVNATPKLVALRMAGEVDPPKPKLRPHRVSGATCKSHIAYSIFTYRGIVFYLVGSTWRCPAMIPNWGNGVKMRFQALERKAGISKIIRNFPKFEHITELASVKNPQSHFCIGESPSRSIGLYRRDVSGTTAIRKYHFRR